MEMNCSELKNFKEKKEEGKIYITCEEFKYYAPFYKNEDGELFYEYNEKNPIKDPDKKSTGFRIGVKIKWGTPKEEEKEE